MESRERYDELCRLCASYDAVKMDIFGQEGKNRQLVDKIETCLPFKVQQHTLLKAELKSGAAAAAATAAAAAAAAGSAIKSQHGDSG
ncbi:hypothetical protein G9C98_006444 [Cotesia typhae]|uniref:Uncharacterized protein n=1 Tax=Cotesia typhae TaxID=2053667 RepID=A0A8J5V8N5_9HYME|nr:hypothetical protein G9C98_006444 [Cotesia typhae]